MPDHAANAGTTPLLRQLRAHWAARRRSILRAAITALFALALLKLGTELYRLVADSSFHGAIDLRLRRDEVVQWFAGHSIYTEFSRLMYPPQAYVVLWPLTGWSGSWETRWLWAVTSIAALFWLTTLVVRECDAADRHDRLLAVAMVVSMNAVGVAIGNGQLILHILPPLVVALLLLRSGDAGWRTDIAVAALLQVALIKPTVSAPFAWVAMLTTRRVRPLALTAVTYVLLTLLAARFQPADVLTLLSQWADQRPPALGSGSADVHSVLHALGLAAWAAPASLLMFGLLGIWTWHRRTADRWILIGVAAIVARLWTYHGVYDDVLILLPMVALFRIATARDGDEAHERRVHRADANVQAGVLLAAAIAIMAVPPRFVGGAGSVVFAGSHVALWAAMALFLVRAAGVPSTRGQADRSAHAYSTE